jgi:hypothetical protein
MIDNTTGPSCPSHISPMTAYSHLCLNGKR